MPATEVNIKEMDAVIQEIKKNVKHLLAISGGIQGVDRSCDRILASINILELNISDLVDLEDDE